MTDKPVKKPRSRRVYACWLAALALSCAVPAYAAIAVLLHDEFDDLEVVLRAQTGEGRVKELAGEFDALKRKLYPLKKRDFAAMLGAAAKKPAKTYALPCFHGRSLTLGGLMPADPKANKRHTRFYDVGGFAGLEVYYWDRSPEAFVLYFKTDRNFVALKKDSDVEKRLAWDLARWKYLKKWMARQVAKRFPHEVDAAAMRKLYSGEAASGIRERLRAWKDAGKRRGWTLKTVTDATDTRKYLWLRPDKTLAREAYAGLGFRGPGVLPSHFYEYYPNAWGKYFPHRELHSAVGNKGIRSWRWCRPSGVNIQYHTGPEGKWPDSWSWSDPKGNCIRIEWDDNGDGVPDWAAVDRVERKARKALSLDQSWAVHPELVPEASRAPAPFRPRLILRRRPEPAPLPAPPWTRPPGAEDEGTGFTWAMVALGIAAVLLVLWLLRRRLMRLLGKTDTRASE